jgi:hypothetical protein
LDKEKNMDKKEDRNWDKGAGRDKPDHERGGGGGGGGGRQQDSGGSDYRQSQQANRDQGSGGSDYGQMADSKRNQDGEKSDYHYNQEAERLAAEKVAADAKKGGCFPKVAMLLVPFVALATYVLLRS